MTHAATPRLRRISLLLALAFPADAAFARDAELDTVVVSASGFEQELKQAPASISRSRL